MGRFIFSTVFIVWINSVLKFVVKLVLVLLFILSEFMSQRLSQACVLARSRASLALGSEV